MFYHLTFFHDKNLITKERSQIQIMERCNDADTKTFNYFQQFQLIRYIQMVRRLI